MEDVTLQSITGASVCNCPPPYPARSQRHGSQAITCHSFKNMVDKLIPARSETHYSCVYQEDRISQSGGILERGLRQPSTDRRLPYTEQFAATRTQNAQDFCQAHD